MLGLRVIYDEDKGYLTGTEQTEKDYLTIKSDSPYGGLKDGNLNRGFAGDSYNYLKLFRTNDKSKAATSFDLRKDDDCRSYDTYNYGDLRNDITKGAILHPDCRYLTHEEREDETPITKIFLSRTEKSDATCTNDINAGRKSGFTSSLYLCWEKEEGD